ncbi:hypothetical protein E8E14_011260 [Neopestalotiopsis sp. 37M]|nr:hypothetical protein E8E14_011260 [Neopestalotiopsis sp. 37M]
MASISQKIKEEEKDDGGIDEEIISHDAACYLAGVVKQEEKLDLSHRTASQLPLLLKEEENLSLTHYAASHLAVNVKQEKKPALDAKISHWSPPELQ